MASSPIVAAETVVVRVEADTDAFAVGLDASAGSRRWRLARLGHMSLCSPILCRSTQCEPLVVLQGSRGAWVLRPLNGEPRGRCDAEKATIPSSLGFGPLPLVPSGGLTTLKLPDSGTELVPVWRRASLRTSHRAR